MPKLYLILVLFISLCFAACSKNGGSGSGEKVAIYRMQNTPPLPISCKIDSANLQLSTEPLISNNDILSYDQRDHEFRVKDEAGARLKNVRDNETLAIVVGSEVVYYFINKPLYSSSICNNSISMNHINGNTLGMSLITVQPGTPIPDPRNDARLLNALRSQRKLK